MEHLVLLRLSFERSIFFHCLCSKFKKTRSVGINSIGCNCLYENVLFSVGKEFFIINSFQVICHREYFDKKKKKTRAFIVEVTIARNCYLGRHARDKNQIAFLKRPTAVMTSKNYRSLSYVCGGFRGTLRCAGDIIDCIASGDVAGHSTPAS